MNRTAKRSAAWRARQPRQNGDPLVMNHPGDDRAVPPAGGGPDRGLPGSAPTELFPEPVDLRALLREGPFDESELVEIVCNDQAQRWSANRRIPAESYLGLHPLLGSGGEATFEIIYNEYLLRESLGETPSIEEFAWRFPKFSDRLRRQLEIHQALLPEPDAEGADLAGWPTLTGAEPATPRAGISGLRIPGFDLLEEVGRGGTGVVYKARQHRLNRLVALKVIRAGVCDTPDVVARFRAEAEAAARFQHPNLINVYEVGERDGLAYLALEFAAGGSLCAKIAGTPQEPRESARLVESLARAVHYAHQRGIVHRDLKPANVVLTEDGVAKVTDFGLAKLLEHDGGLTRTGDILGTPSYMSPEQAQGLTEEITPATDLYSLGAILYEMLTGRPPFQGRSPLSALEMVVSQEPVPPGKLQPSVPRDLETICLKCLEKGPRQRYADAMSLAADLRRYLDGETIQARPSSVFEKTWKWGRRRPAAAIALGVLVTALSLLIVGAIYAGARLRESNNRLVNALAAARQSRRESEGSRIKALEQRNLALKAMSQLVFGVQDRLNESPGTRPLRRSLLGVATSGLDEIARGAEASEPDLSRAVAHQKLGELFRQVGRADEARRQLEMARQLSARLAEAAPDDAAVSDCLIKAGAGLGQLHLDAEQYEAARQVFERVVGLAEAGVRAHPEREASRRMLVEAYFQLGRTFGFQGELARAETWFRKTRDIAARWAAQEPGNTWFRDTLASVYRKLADMKKLAGDLAAARHDYLEAIALDRNILTTEPANLESQCHLALALDDLAGVAYRQGARDEAGRLYGEAERVLSGLAAVDPEDQLVQVHLVLVWNSLGKLLRDGANHAGAAAQFRRALGRLTRLEHEGRLEGRRRLALQLFTSLREGVADCESAADALGDLDTLLSRPVGDAATLLLTRERLLRAEGRSADALAAAAALCRLEAHTAADLDTLARSLEACALSLDDEHWPGPPLPERPALRRLCTDRAIAARERSVRPGH